MDKKYVKPSQKDNSNMGQHGDNLRFGILQSQSKSTEAIYTFLLLKIRFTQLRLTYSSCQKTKEISIF